MVKGSIKLVIQSDARQAEKTCKRWKRARSGSRTWRRKTPR